MRVVRDAESTVEPIGLSRDRFSVVQRLRFDLEGDPYAERLREILHELRVFGDVGVVLGRQRHVDP